MIYPHPGPLAARSAPKPGESISLHLDGLPPFKEVRRSIRNPRHPRYEAFQRLREAAIAAMDGRECYSGAVGAVLRLYAPQLDRSIGDYAAGIEDTLDGSHGVHFTYLPIVYQDDCQVCSWHSVFVRTAEMFYELEITFLPDVV